MNTEEEIRILKDRNKRVETDKAWEMSWTRRILISIFTYVIASIWLYLIHESNFWLKAVIPTAGYVLSTISLPFFKRIWINNLD